MKLSYMKYVFSTLFFVASSLVFGATYASAQVCASDTQCSDSDPCNGVERCVPGGARSDSFGCEAGTPPCPSGQSCTSVRSLQNYQCVPEGCEGTLSDRDGDGYSSIQCGGSDCDDRDANRYPGNVEVCDSLGHDEDCDPQTFGDRDDDNDGYIDQVCAFPR